MFNEAHSKVGVDGSVHQGTQGRFYPVRSEGGGLSFGRDLDLEGDSRTLAKIRLGDGEAVSVLEQDGGKRLRQPGSTLDLLGQSGCATCGAEGVSTTAGSGDVGPPRVWRRGRGAAGRQYRAEQNSTGRGQWRGHHGGRRRWMKVTGCEGKTVGGGGSGTLASSMVLLGSSSAVPVRGRC